MVVLTDGGGPHRVAQSQNGLRLLGLLDHATYLNFSEKSFYEALLSGDTELFSRVAIELRAVIERFQPDQIFCDAIEFYNPVHDITRPLLLRALAGLPEIPLFEVPLVYQAPVEGEVYEIQRIPESQAHLRLSYDLSEEELAAKVYARDHIHTSLHDQAGPEFVELSPRHMQREEIAAIREDLPEPDEASRVLRYEWRARLLHEQGAIDRIITYRDHFLPAASRLLTAG